MTKKREHKPKSEMLGVKYPRKYLDSVMREWQERGIIA